MKVQITETIFGYILEPYPVTYANSDVFHWRPTRRWAEFTARRLISDAQKYTNRETWIIGEEDV